MIIFAVFVASQVDQVIVSNSKAFANKERAHDSQNHTTLIKTKIDVPKVGIYEVLDDFVREIAMLRWLEATKNSDPIYDYSLN